MKKIFFVLTLVFLSLSLFSFEADSIVSSKKSVYSFNMRKEIGPAIWRQTKQAFQEAKELNSDYFVINMNTYGGAVVQADSIRTLILNSSIPVFVFIDNNAASAGALISIACDKIYMRKGASIGAATVVNQTGQAMPDKYQSYMRSIMRATCESHGKDTIITAKDTIVRWKRNPLIAEAMVDQDLAIQGIIDTGKLVTLTPTEAIKYGFCDGMAENISEVLAAEKIENYTISEYRATALENLIGFLVNPIFQAVLIILIIGGLYFELQTPGVGFPIVLSLLAAIVYFAPLYLEGLAANYEIIIFVVGIILLALEIFVIPGFGVAGILGIVGIVLGLALAMVDNYGFSLELNHLVLILRAVSFVFVLCIAALLLSLYFSKRIITNKSWAFALHAEQKIEDGFIAVDSSFSDLIGKDGLAYSDLRPSGKVIIDGCVYDALSLHSAFIVSKSKIRVVSFKAGQLNVEKI